MECIGSHVFAHILAHILAQCELPGPLRLLYLSTSRHWLSCEASDRARLPARNSLAPTAHWRLASNVTLPRLDLRGFSLLTHATREAAVATGQPAVRARCSPFSSPLTRPPPLSRCNASVRPRAGRELPLHVCCCESRGP
jgi:hypothetical protein